MSANSAATARRLRRRMLSGRQQLQEPKSSCCRSDQQLKQAASHFNSASHTRLCTLPMQELFENVYFCQEQKAVSLERQQQSP
jgi:hypothetical protein